MVDKYPNLSPYVYCAGNPVKYFDEKGEEIDGPDDPPKNVFQRGWKAFKRFDDFLLSGHSDGANRGTITEQDKAVGEGAIAIIVTGGAALEAGTALAVVASLPSIASSIDDMTTDASGQTAAQRAAGDNSTARKAVDVSKTGSSMISVVSSGRTIAEKGISEASACLLDVANSTYNSVKSLMTTVKDFIKGNDNKDKKTKE